MQSSCIEFSYTVYILYNRAGTLASTLIKLIDCAGYAWLESKYLQAQVAALVHAL